MKPPHTHLPRAKEECAEKNHQNTPPRPDVRERTRAQISTQTDRRLKSCPQAHRPTHERSKTEKKRERRGPPRPPRHENARTTCDKETTTTKTQGETHTDTCMCMRETQTRWETR